MPSLVGLEPLIHIPFYQYNVPVGFYQYAVPGGTGTLASQTFLPIQRPCGVLPTCRPGGGYQHAVLAGATNMPSLCGGYQHAVPGGTGTISFPVLLPIYRPWRDSTNITSLAGLEPYHSRFCYQYTVPGGTGIFLHSVFFRYCVCYGRIGTLKT